jgi:hypothetical protein
MPSIAILHEAQQLHDVSDRLDALAGQHRHLRKRSQYGHSAGGAGRDEDSAALGIRSSKCLICSSLSLSWSLGFLRES